MKIITFWKKKLRAIERYKRSERLPQVNWNKGETRLGGHKLFNFTYFCYDTRALGRSVFIGIWTHIGFADFTMILSLSSPWIILTSLIEKRLLQFLIFFFVVVVVVVAVVVATTGLVCLRCIMSRTAKNLSELGALFLSLSIADTNNRIDWEEGS